MNEDLSLSITVTKLDAARRQIETALDLWFHKGDAVSVHTLAGAAHRVVHDIAILHGKGATLLDDTLLEKLGFDPKVFMKHIRAAETFFKHAEKDPRDSLSFSEEGTSYILYSAVECYRRLDHNKSPLMTLFMAWIHFRHPETLAVFARKQFGHILPRINELTRADFFKTFRDLPLDF